jgi:uncharacterized membrane protein
MYHAVGNVIGLLFFIGSWWLRSDAPARPETLASMLSFAGLGFAAVGGWLGGELVERLGVGVDDGANLDAPSSLTEERAARKAAHR